MSLSVSQRPAAYCPSGNPMMYKLQRKDRAWNTLNSSSGSIRIVITGVDVTSLFAVGDVLWLQSDSGTYSQLVNVASRTFTGGNTEVVMVESYVAGATNGYVNLLTARPDYRIEARIYNAAGAVQTPAFEYTATSLGLHNVDVHTPVHNLLSADFNTTVFSDAMFLNQYGHIRFYLGYTEVWTGSAESETLDSSNILCAIYATKQVGELPNFDLYTSGTIKFLNKLSTLIWPKEYDYVLSFISTISDSRVCVDYYNAAGSIEDSITSDSPGTLGVYEIKLSEVSDKPLYSYAKVYIKDISSGLVISEVLTITFVDACDPCVYLRWKNSLGGWSQFYFGYNQLVTAVVVSEGRFNDKQLYAEGLNRDDYYAFLDLLSSGEVYRKPFEELTSTTELTHKRVGQQVYSVAVDGTKTGVIADVSTIEINTKNKAHSVRVHIRPPQIQER